jgi:hypothetical protein
MHPVFECELLPGDVEVAFWFVEAKRDNEKDWREEIQQPEASKNIERPTPHLAACAHHAKSSVPKILV